MNTKKENSCDGVISAAAVLVYVIKVGIGLFQYYVPVFIINEFGKLITVEY